MRSISSLERRPFSLVIVIDSDLPLSIGKLSSDLIEKRLWYLHSLVGSRDLHDTVRINLEGDLLGDKSASCWSIST